MGVSLISLSELKTALHDLQRVKHAFAALAASCLTRTMASMLSQILSLTLLVGYIRLASTTPGVFQWIANLEASNSSLLRYPTQLTQGIVPKQIHSHNDCLCALYWS